MPRLTPFHPSHLHHTVYKALIEDTFTNPENPPVIESQDSNGCWREDASPEWFPNRTYRIRPKTVTRTVSYREPLLTPPKLGTPIWIVQAIAGEPLSEVWTQDESYSKQVQALENGMVFSSKADAQDCYYELFGYR